MRISTRNFVILLLLAAAVHAAGPEPDVLVFIDGEKLIGHLIRSNGNSVTFKSDVVGEITADWSKIKELRSSQKFAIIKKGVTLGKHDDVSGIPRGSVSMADQRIEVQGGVSPETIPVAEASHVIDEAAFEKAGHKPGLFKEWKGAITAGASLVSSTQDSRTFTAAIHVVRTLPAVDWLKLRNRTRLNLSEIRGIVTQPNTPSVKTSILHGDAERDEYLAPRLFAFGQVAYDHNISQGLDLAQTYGGGIGWVVRKRAASELDFKVSGSYIKQAFQNPSQNQNLFGTTFGETYNRQFSRGILLVENLAITPAWNNTKAYSAASDVTLTVPAYKRLNVALAAMDAFLNNPPPGFKKNSLQFTMGLSFALP